VSLLGWSLFVSTVIFVATLYLVQESFANIILSNFTGLILFELGYIAVNATLYSLIYFLLQVSSLIIYFACIYLMDHQQVSAERLNRKFLLQQLCIYLLCIVPYWLFAQYTFK